MALAKRYHSQLTIAHGIHAPHAYSYADAAARAADTSRNANDVYKFGLQVDNKSVWMLTAITPTWVMVSPGTGVWPLAQGGTNAALTAAAGGMVYSTASALAISAAADLQWDNPNKRFGIGLGANAFQSTRFDLVGTVNPVVYFTNDPVNNPANPTEAWLSAEIQTTATSGVRFFIRSTLNIRSASGTLSGCNTAYDIDDYPTGVASELLGSGSTVNHFAQNTLPVAKAFQGAINTWNALGTDSDITNAYVFYIRKDVNNGGTIANYYGFYCPDVSDIATNPWAFYSAGATKSFIGGQLLIGDATIGSALGRIVFKTGTTVADGIEFGTDGANAIRFYRWADRYARLEGRLEIVAPDYGGIRITSAGSPALYFNPTGGGSFVLDNMASTGIYFTFNSGNTNVFNIDQYLDVHAYGNVDLASGKVYKVNATQVVGARVVDARIDDEIEAAFTTLYPLASGVLDALRDGMITHGLFAAA